MGQRGSLLVLLVAVMYGLPMDSVGQTPFFNYRKYLIGPQSTLEVYVASLDTTSGDVVINGGDSRSPTIPFIWVWGDGTVTDGFFPSSHTYADQTRNYNVQVIATYSPGEHDTADVVVRFVPPSITPIPLSLLVAVYVPDHPIMLGTRLYTPPSQLTAFADSFFRTISRSTLEYILSVAATHQRDFVNDNMYLFDAKFEEYMLRDPFFGGAYSLWFTDPVAFGAGDGFMRGIIGYSSLFHEMGHNFTLNTPASYYYGGRIDGNANAIYSESMGQIFQHAAGYEVVNSYQAYGLSEDLMLDIKQEAIRTIKVVRRAYEDYLSAGKPFSSWNDPGTPEDETFGTFMTIGYKFCEHAENAGLGYRQPVKRMMQLLQGFNTNWAERYDRLNNTADADTFRATLLVAAVSYAFSTDLRGEFRLLHFPISDQIYTQLYNSPVPIQLASFTGGFVSPNVVRLAWQTISEVNNYGFEVQRGHEGTFVTLPNSFVPGHGTTNEPHEYRYIDASATCSVCFYRLRQMDLDGTVHYSDAIRADMSTGVKERGTPTFFSLSQNYPNPCNAVTTINYSVPLGRDFVRATDGQCLTTSYVTLKVFDVLGRELATLVNEVKPAGTYSVVWNASNMGSGVYFYRLAAGPFHSTAKALLLR